MQRNSTYIPCCPRCGEGKVIVSPVLLDSQEHAITGVVMESFYCDHCTGRFKDSDIIWKKI